MLELRSVIAGYGETRVLHGMDLGVARGEVVALLGRNGVGKTTTLRAVMGIVRPEAGEIRFDGHPLTGLETWQIARLGVAYVPETRDIFPSLTVEENLDLAAAHARPRAGGWTLARVFELFPRLAERRRHPGNALSGGEQQMLAIGRALLQNPEVLLLDEPTEGLAPVVIDEIHARLRELETEGMAILLVEQNLRFAASLADRCCVVHRGRIEWSGAPAALLEDEALHRRWLGV